MEEIREKEENISSEAKSNTSKFLEFMIGYMLFQRSHNPNDGSAKKSLEFLRDIKEKKTRGVYFWMSNSILAQNRELSRREIFEEGGVYNEQQFIEAKKRFFAKMAQTLTSNDEFHEELLKAPVLIPFGFVASDMSILRDFFNSSMIEIYKVPKMKFKTISINNEKDIAEIIDNRTPVLSTSFFLYKIFFSQAFYSRVIHNVGFELTFDKTTTLPLEGKKGIQKTHYLTDESTELIYDYIKESVKNTYTVPTLIYTQSNGDTIIYFIKNKWKSSYVYRLYCPNTQNNGKVIDNFRKNLLKPDPKYSWLYRSPFYIQRDSIFESLDSPGNSANDFFFFSLKNFLTLKQFDETWEELSQDLVQDFFANRQSAMNLFYTPFRIYGRTDDAISILYMTLFQQRFISPDNDPLKYSSPVSELKFKSVFEFFVEYFIHATILKFSEQPYSFGFEHPFPTNNVFSSFGNIIRLFKITPNEDVTKDVFVIPSPIEDQLTRRATIKKIHENAERFIKLWEGQHEKLETSIKLFFCIKIHERFILKRKKREEEERRNTLHANPWKNPIFQRYIETVTCVAMCISIMAKFHVDHIKNQKFYEYLDRNFEFSMNLRESAGDFESIFEMFWKMSHLIILIYSFNKKSPYAPSPEINAYLLLRYLQDEQHFDHNE